MGRHTKGEERVAAACGAGAAVLGVLGLVGWVLGITFLVRVRPGYHGIAPSIALALIVLGVAQAHRALGSPRLGERIALTPMLLIGAFSGLLEVVDLLTGTDPNFEDTLTRALARSTGIPFEPMSPVSGILLCLVSLATLSLVWAPGGTCGRRRHLVALAGVVGAAVALVAVLGYLYQEPVRYSQTWLPIPAASALGFLLLSTGAIALAGRRCWPMRAFVGPSTPARLLRVFVPLVAVAVLVTAGADLYRDSVHTNRGLFAAGLASVCAIAAVLVVSQAARVIGTGIDAAHQAQRAAERERDKQARLVEAILEHTETLLAYLDRDFRFVRVNSAYAQAGRRSDQDYLGRSHFELYPHAENQAIFERVRDTGEPFEIREKPFEHPDQPERGTTYWDWTLAPVKSEAGEVEGLVLSLSDVTESVRQRQRLVEAERARAEIAERMTAEINHRMKNTLMLVVGVLQMQVLDLRPEAVEDALRDAIGRISAVSAVHEQFHEGRGSQANLCELLRRVGTLAVEALRATNAAVAVHGDATIFASPKLCTTLALIANELVTNAVQHGGTSEDGRRHITIGLSRRQGRLAIEVWSSGNPLPAGADPGREPGTGLHLVRSVVEQDLRGQFSLGPHREGTLATVTVDDAVLSAGGVAPGFGINEGQIL